MMTGTLYVEITDTQYIYGNYLISELYVEQLDKRHRNYKNTQMIQLDSVFVHYLMKEIKLCDFYRKCFSTYWKNSLKIILKVTIYDLIDYRWNEYVYFMARERCELDHSLSWLSTLGGAFSALGDYFVNCAETAGRISYHQLRLALMLGDPNIASRCRLYFSLSLIQKKRFKRAQKIIYNEYSNAMKSVVKDHKLLNMCKGIWSKLQYEYNLFKIKKGETKRKTQ